MLARNMRNSLTVVAPIKGDKNMEFSPIPDKFWFGLVSEERLEFFFFSGKLVESGLTCSID